MSIPLRVIIVEDREEDAILMGEALRDAGFKPDWVRVDTEQDFRERLNDPPDLILADYLLPQFNGQQALRIAKESGRDIPFLIVSGSIGEELAVAALQLGADDYLFKDRLTRLGAAVERALAEKQLRDEKRLIEQALRDSEKRFQVLIEHSVDVINLLDEAGQILYASPSVTHILGYTPEENVGRNMFDLIHPDDVARERQDFLQLQHMPRATIRLRLRVRHRDGSWRNLGGTATNLLDEPAVRAIVINYRDVTERIQAEAALQESERFARATLNALSAHIAILDEQGTIVAVNQAWNEFAQANAGSLDRSGVGVNYLVVCDTAAGASSEEAAVFAAGIRSVLNGERDYFALEYPCHSLEGQRWFYGRVTRFPGDGPVRIVVAHENITERRLAEEQTANALAYGQTLLEASPIGVIAYRQSGETASVNEAAACMLGATVEQLAAQNFRQITSWQQSGLLALAEEALATRQAVEQEVHHLSTFGKDIWLNARFVPFTYKSEKHLLGMFTDITQRKQTEQALQESERRERERAAELQTIMDAAPAAVLIAYDQMAQLVTGNHTAYEMLHLPPGSNVSLTPAADQATAPYRIHQSGRELPPNDLPLQAAAATGVEINDCEEEIILADGTIVYTLGNIRPLFDDFERPRGAVGVYIDITARKQTEEALRQHVVRLTMLNDVGRHIAAKLDVDQVLNNAARLIHENFGYDHVGLFVLDRERTEQVLHARSGAYTHLVPGTHRLPVTEGMVGWVTSHGHMLLANDVRVEPAYVNRYGEQAPTQSELAVPISIGAEVLGALDIQSSQLNAFDNTDVLVMQTLADQIATALQNARLYEAAQRELDERTQAEEALRASEARFRALIENGTDLISILDAEGHFVYESPSSVRMLGFEPQELIGRSAFEFAHPDDLQGLIEVLGQIMQASPGPAVMAEGRFRHKDGSWRYLETISHNLLNDPAINGIVVNSRDVTERRAAEQALRQAEVSYRQLFEEMPIGLYRTTPEGEYIDANQALIRLLGCPDRDTLLTTSAASFYVNSEDRNREHEQLFRDQVVHRYEVQLRRLDETVIWVEDNLRLMRDPEGLYTYYEGSLQDITDRKERERELEAIAGVSAALRTARTHAEMLSIVLDQIYALMIVDGASIATRDPATGESVFEAGRGTGEGYIGRRVPAGVGVIGHVIASGHVYLTNDAQRDPNFFWPHLLGPLHAVACVPLVVQEHTIGALWIGRRIAISALELRLLEAIADIAGSAIHRAALYEAERKQRVLAESLRDTAAALSSTLNYDEVLDLILFRAQHVVPHDHARVVLIEARKGYVVRSRGYGAATPGASFDLEGQPHLKQIEATGRPLIIPDTNDFPGWAYMPELHWVRSYVGMPIRLKGQVAGFLILASAAPGFFRSTDSERIQAFADQCAIAIENARLYQEVSRYAEELETRVADRTRELVEANQRLQELDRLKSKFVSDVSHELRTPVTSLSLHAELLETGKPERRDYYIKILQEQARRLNQLVEDILNLSRLELGAQRVQFETVDLNQLADNVVAAHQPSAEIAGLELIFTPGPDVPPIQGEPNQLAQVITNLVANALNYTRRGHVHVSTYQSEQGACLEVQDTGLGIDQEDVPHLFDRFYRGQQATRSKIRGTGLGLAIVKEIVDLHGGTITVDSTVGQGSTFRITLPHHNPVTDSSGVAGGER